MTKKTIRHHIIASAAHDGEPGVIAKSQKPAPSIKLSKEMHPVVVLVASGSTLYSFITIAIYMLCVQKILKLPRKQEENTPKTKIFLAMEIGCTPKMYLCKFNMILVYYLPISHPSWLR